jgi:hypothetical protein
MKIAIVGAGFTGLVAAFLLEKKGHQVTVYEKEEIIGGHCRTIIRNNQCVEVGAVFSFSQHIKELLIELKISYSERFTYRNFFDERFKRVEHLSYQEAKDLLVELNRLKLLLEDYALTYNVVSYGYIHPDLLIPFARFLEKHQLTVMKNLIAPHFSSFGFGDIYTTQAYYALVIFNLDTISAFLQGEKLLFIDKGVSELIHQLSCHISNIRYAHPVVSVETVGDQVRIESHYDCAVFDKVLITTKLPKHVIKDSLLNDKMGMIETNPYVTCTFEVEGKNLVTTYFKGNFGKKNKIQFFHTFKQGTKTMIVTYSYGMQTPQLISDIIEDLTAAQVKVLCLIYVKQWYIFPHVKTEHLYPDFYCDLQMLQSEMNVHFIGSLVSKPVLSTLYVSIKQHIDKNF